MSDSDSTSGRPPPTIELTATELPATEVASPKTQQDTAPGAKDAATNAAPEDNDAAKNAAKPGAASTEPPKAQKEPNAKAAKSASAIIPHAISAATGAIAAAVVLIGLWLAGFTLARDAVNSQTADLAPQSGTAGDAAISARLDKIEHALQARPPETATIPPALDKRLTAVELQAKMLGDTAATLGHRVDDVASTAQNAQKQASAAASAADATKDAVQSAGQTGVQQNDIEAMTSRIAALESAVKGLTDAVAHPTPSADAAVRLTVAAQALQAAVERGAPFQAELKAVQALGAAPSATAPLEAFAATGLPRVEPLVHELAALVPALRQATDTSSGDTTFLGKLKANMHNLVDFTPAEPPPGNDPAAVMTRIDIDADRGDIAAALNDIAALPDHAKALTADWAQKAQARQDALAASRNISAETLAALSKPAAQ